MKIILYVEDNPVTLTAYKNRLESDGFQVKAAQDGVEAVKILTQCVPDLVLLDLMMPKFNGGDVLKFIRATPSVKAVPVVILSTNSILDAAQKYFLEQADRRLLKETCTYPELLKTIQELLSVKNPSGHTENN